MNRKFRNCVAVASTAAVILLGVGSPAFAGQGDIETTCPDNNICMWEDNNFGGNKDVEQYYLNSQGHLKTYNIDGWNGDNELSSLRNNSDYWVCVYPNDNTWGGGHIKVAPNKEYSNLASSFGFDNNAESLKFVNETGDCN